jgi:uncharacterized protein YgiM (DUF1202 family)
MKTWTVIWGLVLTMPLPLLAQTTAPTSLPDLPAGAVAGEVTGSNIYIRVGPSTSDYFVAKISSPARVTIVGQKNGWLQVAPTQGCYSIIAKQYVQLEPSGKFGTVTGDGVWVRAAGELKTGQKLSDFWSLQKQVNKGDRVEVLSAGSDYYAIVTPPGGLFWISGQYVKHSGTVVTVAAAEPEARVPVAASSRPAASQPTTRSISAAQAALDAAEAELKAQWQKPWDQRDLKGLMTKYQSIDTSDDAYVKLAVEARTKWLTEEMARVQKIRDWVAQWERAQAEQMQRENERINMATSTTAVVPVVPEYALKGTLDVSAVFTGDAGNPKRYVVYNLQTREIAGYAQAGIPEAQEELAKAVGKVVGLFGGSRYDRGLRATLVDVQRVEVLNDKGEAPVPPKPVVAPMPTPRPTSAPAAPDAVVPEATSKPAPTSAPAAPPLEPPVKLAPPPDLPDTGLPVAPPTSGPAATIDSSLD